MKILNKIKNYFKDWNTFEKLWLFAFTLVNIYLFFAWKDSWIGLTASLTGMLCVVLTAKAKLSSFYWGLINIFAYSYVAFSSKYYGDVMLNLGYFLPMTFIGIYYWKKNLDKKDATVKVTSLDMKNKILWFVISLALIFDYGLLLRWMGGTLPFVDSLTTVFSVVATILLNKRCSDQWFYWIMVDVFSIVMWVFIFIRDGNQVSMLVMWTAFLVNAAYGYYNWKKLEKKNQIVGEM
jgi:nicotinamide mononucleotide transporter